MNGYDGCFLFVLLFSIVCVVIACKCKYVKHILPFYIPWVILVNFISAILFLSPYGFAG